MDHFVGWDWLRFANLPKIIRDKSHTTSKANRVPVPRCCDPCFFTRYSLFDFAKFPVRRHREFSHKLLIIRIVFQVHRPLTASIKENSLFFRCYQGNHKTNPIAVTLPHQKVDLPSSSYMRQAEIQFSAKARTSSHADCPHRHPSHCRCHHGGCGPAATVGGWRAGNWRGRRLSHQPGKREPADPDDGYLGGRFFRVEPGPVHHCRRRPPAKLNIAADQRLASPAGSRRAGARGAAWRRIARYPASGRKRSAGGPASAPITIGLRVGGGPGSGSPLFPD